MIVRICDHSYPRTPKCESTNLPASNIGTAILTELDSNQVNACSTSYRFRAFTISLNGAGIGVLPVDQDARLAILRQEAPGRDRLENSGTRVSRR